MELTKKQSSVFVDNSKNKIVICGRRGGKTYLVLTEILYKLANNPNYVITYVAPTHKQAKKIFWEPFKELVPNQWIKSKSEVDLDMKLINGSVLMVGSAQNYDRLRGLTNNEFYIDEVQDTIEEVYTKALRPTIATTKGKATFLGTPKGFNWVSEYINKDVWSYHTWTTLEGGLVDEEEIERAKLELDEKSFRQEYLAEFLTSSGAIFYTFDNESIVDVDFKANETTYLSFDFNVNPMTCVLFQNNIAVKEFEEPHSNTYDLSNKILRYLQTNNFNSSLFITGDNTGGSSKTSATKTDYQIIYDIFKNYLPVDAWRKTKHVLNIEDRFNTTNSAFKSYSNERKLFINRKCEKLIKYLRVITRDDYKRDTMNRTHLIDCLTYYPFNYLPIRQYELGKL